MLQIILKVLICVKFILINYNFNYNDLCDVFGVRDIKMGHSHCMKSVRIRSFSGPYFPAFGLNTERYGV